MTSKEGGLFNNAFSPKQRELAFKTGGVILFVSNFVLCFVVNYDDAALLHTHSGCYYSSCY